MKSVLSRLFQHQAVPVIIGFTLFTINISAAPIQQSLTDTALISKYLKMANSEKSGSSDSATSYYQRAISIANGGVTSSNKSIRNKTLKQLILAELGLGLIYYQNVDYTNAMQHYQLAYNSAKLLGQPFYTGECLFNFGEVNLEQSQYQQAMYNYNEAKLEYEKAKDNAGVYWCYVGMGIAQKQCGNFADALICYKNALAIAAKANMKQEKAYCHNNLGNVYRQQGNYVKAMEEYETALSEFNAMNDNLAASDCLNNIGNLYLDKGDPFKAMEYYKQSMNYEKVKSDNFRMISRYKNLADAYSMLKDYTNAAMFLDNAEKLAQKAGDKAQIASCYSLIGDLQIKNSNQEIGISYLKKSAEIFNTIGAKSEEAEVLVSLAIAELNANQLDDAQKHAERAELLATNAGAVKILSNASDCLSQLWEKKGDTQKSLLYMKKVLVFKDSLFSVAKNRAIEEIGAGFTRTRLENENQILAQNSKLQQQLLKNRNIAVFALILSLLFALCITWLVYKRNLYVKTMAKREKSVIEKEMTRLSSDLVTKERELTTKTLLINQKNVLLQKLIEELDKLKDGNSINKIGQLQHELKQELSPNAWKEFETQFNEVHPGFQNRILERFPELSPTERRICTFLRLDMNTREIASLTGQTFKSLEVARTRIRKKMDLTHENNLTNFIALI